MLNTSVLALAPPSTSGLRSVVDITRLPANVRAKRLKSGVIAYYWEAPSRDRKKGCPLRSRPLGTDRLEAIGQAMQHNGELARWRTLFYARTRMRAQRAPRCARARVWMRGLSSLAELQAA